MENEIKNKCEHGFDLMKRKVKQNSSISKDIMKRLSELFKGVFEINPEKRWDLIRIVKFVSNK